MQEQPHKRGGLLRLILSLLLLVFAIGLFLNRQYVLDAFAAWQYEPTAVITEIVQDSSMTDDARFLFYASHPEVNDRETFSQRCTSAGEQTVVLGCYSGNRIYIFDVDDPRLEGIEEVTAAHEMLHAAYARLSDADKDRVNSLLEEQLKLITDPRIMELIKIYDKTEPGQRLNELHSIFATEVADLLPELEQYYDRYFEDRSAVVALSDQYEAVFSSIQDQQAALVAELNALSEQISADTADYNAAVNQLNRDIDAFNRRADNNFYTSQAAFDTDRQSLMTRMAQVQALNQSINADIALYNEKRKELEAINGQVEQLNQSINSNALEPAPSL